MQTIEKFLKRRTKNILGLKETASLITLFALLFSMGSFNFVLASGNYSIYFDDINYPIIDGFMVQIGGTAHGDPHVGQTTNHNVSIDCGLDGNDIADNWIPADNFTITESGGQGNETWFNAEWIHTCNYSDVGAGSYVIFARVHHSQVSGAEGSDVATVRIDIIIIDPDTYALAMAVYPADSGTATDETGNSPYEANTIVNIKAEPEVGFQFIEWTAPAGSFGDDEDSETTFTMPAQNITVTANFEKDDNQWATINFVAGDNGSLVGNTSFEVLKGTEWSEITVPTPDPDLGYMFDEWDPELPEDTDTIQENATYTAKFEEVPPGTYTLNMAVDPDGSGTATDVTGKSSYEENEEVEIKAEANASYQFVNWTATAGIIDEEDNPETNFIMPATNTTVTANFVLKEYTVTFKDWDGTELKVETVEHGSDATAPDEPTRDGYTFTGWNTGFTSVTEDLTVTAQYEINKYTVTFHGNGGEPTTSTKEVDHGSTTTLPADPIRDGYTFEGWKYCYQDEIEVCEFFTENTEVFGDMDVYAIWEEIEEACITVFKDFENVEGMQVEPSYFSFTVNGGDPIHFDFDGYAEVCLPVGTSYEITEVNPGEDWHVSTSDDCEGTMGDVIPNGNAVSENGLTCIITNTWVEEEKEPEPDPDPEDPILGCTDPTANNYNPDATKNDGSCIYGRRGGGGGTTVTPTEPTTGEVLGEEIVVEKPCGIYLYEYIKYGADNNPYEVQKLQTFLNQYMGSNLTVSGVYDLATMEAVNQFQLQCQDQILNPWVEVGVHCDINQPTGYVYKTTQRWINLIMCPTLNLPMPSLSAYPQTDCAAYWGENEVLGEEIDHEEDLPEEEPYTEEDPEDVPEWTAEAGPETEDTEERERGTPWLFILIVVLLIAGLGWISYKMLRKK